MKKSNYGAWNLANLFAIRYIIQAILLFLFSEVVHAQCTNNWAGSSPDITFRLEKDTIHSFSITLTGIPCFSSINFTFSAITLSNDSFKLNIYSYPTTGTITGKFSEDYNSITGTYNISLKYLNQYGVPVSCGIVSGSWSASAETPRPTAEAGDDTTVCAGQDVTLTATGGESYSWSGGITNGISFTPAETGTYTVTVTATNGCTDSDSVMIIIKPLPTANAGEDVTVCAGQSVTLTATGGESYSWNGGITNGVEFIPAETKIYTVTVTAANGCTDMDTLNVTVNPLPMAEAGNNKMVCAGQSVILTATGGESYSWSGGITNGIPFKPAESGTYNVTVISTDGCTDTDSVLIMVNPLPEANAGNDTTVCMGQGVTLTATGGESYSWSGGITNGIPFLPAESGTYTVTVTAMNGCTDTASVIILVNSLPEANAGNDTTVCPGQGVTLTASGGESYSWSGGITNGVEFIPAETETYMVTVTSANGCTDTDEVAVTVNNCTYIDTEEKDQFKIDIFPNPAYDKITIEYPNPDNNKYWLRIYDLSGNIVKNFGTTTNSEIEVDSSILPEGFFIIEIAGNKIYRGKVLIQH